MRHAFRFGIVSIVCVLSSFGQSGSSVVKGTVSDVSSAVVQGAKLRLINRDTNIAREETSHAGGLFNFADVAPGPYQPVVKVGFFPVIPNGQKSTFLGALQHAADGHLMVWTHLKTGPKLAFSPRGTLTTGCYTLEVEQSGFEKWSGNFEVQVGQTAVIDSTLAVGSVANTVVVNDAAPAITAEGMQVSDVKDALRIHQLPLNGRLVSSLFTLTPGVENNGSGLRVNGLKVGAVEITQDGISLVDRFTGGIQRVQPGLDTVQEFRIETSSSSARYPRPATLTLITKSGTNDLHGTLFETFRNNADGLRARQRHDSNTSAKLIRNEFGVSAGGPIWIPKLYNGRDKTFWFVSYEGLRQRQSVFNEDYVPTPAMFNGDFSNVFDNNGVQTHIYDPLTTNAQGLRTQFPGDIIPSSRISPIWKTLQTITHPPSSGADPFQGPNLDNFYPLKTETNTFTPRPTIAFRQATVFRRASHAAISFFRRSAACSGLLWTV